jgi:Ca-activated chloride channel family protein
VVPLTEDTNAIDRIANALGPDLIVAPGTNLEEGIQEGLRALPHATFANRAIVLLSDGESLEGDADAALAALRTQGVPLFSIGLGTETGATVPDTDGTPLQDDAGRPVVSRADFITLRSIAEQSGGSFVVAETGGAAREVLRQIARVTEIRESEGFRLVPRRRFGFFVTIALLGLVVAVGVRVVRWRSMF